MGDQRKNILTTVALSPLFSPICIELSVIGGGGERLANSLRIVSKIRHILTHTCKPGGPSSNIIYSTLACAVVFDIAVHSISYNSKYLS